MADWLAGLLHPDLTTLSAAGVYLVLFALVFVESGLLVGVLLPGDTVLFAAGLLAARPGSGLSLPLLAGGVAVAAVAGDAVGYWSGRRLGRPWVARRAGRLSQHLPRAEAFFTRWGWSAVVVARFIPWLRTLTPVVAGTAAMSYPRFVSANVVGALGWGTGLVLLGHVSASVSWVRHLALTVAGISVLVSVVVPVVARFRSRRRTRTDRPD